MGGAASVENSALENMDYEALKASGIDFTVAYKAIQSRIAKGKANPNASDRSINFLAIRQLSQNLKNQEHLEKTRRRVLKSRSLPNNLKYKQNILDSEDLDNNYALHRTVGMHVASASVGEELDAADLAIAADDLEFNVSAEEMSGKKQQFHKTGSALSVRDHQLDKEEQPQAQVVAKVMAPKPKKPKPALFLSVGSDEALQPDDGKPLGLEGHVPHGDLVNALGDDKKPLSPSANMRLSPHGGTLHMGRWKIKENGIFLSESIRGPEGFQLDATHEAAGVSRTLAHPRNEAAGLSHSRMVPPVALGGKNDFIVVATLGSGASGVVSEAIHVPTLTLVALKMLPVYNQQKRQHVSRELAVLYRNLADLRLVDDRLNVSSARDGVDTDEKSADRGAGNVSRCVNVLSLYNAFVDPRSGMINLVIEYMDGGSLEDLVKQGGCRDERVLADIAFQTCKGLSFLHQHKSVHRDIKPANILCSSSGVIKIADFGISKALDKTSGFANSFVGTVCYMSPERIVGETYSFPCDVWSLGLTLLAVAKGRFPLSGREDDDSSSPSAGVARARKTGATDPFGDSQDSPDRHAPIGGAGGYWAMIKAICDEDPPVAGPEFSQQFNAFIASCLGKAEGDRLTAKQLLHHSFITENVDGPDELGPDESDKSRGGSYRGMRPPSLAPISKPNGEASVVQHSTADRLTPPPQSPMTARSATAAVVRRVSRDFSPVAADFHNRSSDAKCGADDKEGGDEETFPYSVRDAIQEEDCALETTDSTGGRRYDPSSPVVEPSPEDDSIIDAIRLEHLDRVLDKIARKLQVGAGAADSSSGGDGGDPFVDAEDEENGLLGTGAFIDLQKLHLDSEAASGEGDAGDKFGSSLDSIDNLLFKDGNNNIADTPDAKKEGDDYFPSPMHVLAASKDANRHTLGHSILKTSSSYKHGELDALGAAAASAPRRHIMLRDTHADYPSYLSYGADATNEEKQGAASVSKSRGFDFASSSRSVHFSEGEGDSQATGGKKKDLRARKNMRALELEVLGDGDEAEGMEVGGGTHALPKTSSYFMSSSAGSAEAKDAVAAPAAVQVDYRAMLPKLNARGVGKWSNLAAQLHLPLHLVKIAVRAKLGAFVDLGDGDGTVFSPRSPRAGAKDST